MLRLSSEVIHRVFPVKTGATPTTQTQSGLLPRLWNVEAKFLVQCAAQRCTDANKIKGTIHLSRCERKNTSHNSETANDINTNARRSQEEWCSLKTSVQLINISIFINVSLWFGSEPIREKLQMPTFICEFKVWKIKNVQEQSCKNHLRRIWSVCKVWRAERQDLWISVFTLTWWNCNESSVVWISSRQHLQVSVSGIDTRKLLPGGKRGFLTCLFVMRRQTVGTA